MNKRCRELSEALIALAEGRSSAEVAEHVAHCGACAKRLAEYREMLEVGRVRAFAAPQEVIARAQAIMPAKQGRVATFLRSSLSLAGARAATTIDFQIVVETGLGQLRLMYVRTESGWDVMGRLPNVEATIERGDSQITADESGRFQFAAENLQDTAFTLWTRDGERVDVPSAEDLLTSER